MAVLQMQKVSICALKKDRKAILEKIQSMGIMEISRFESEEEGFQTVNTQEERSAFEKNAALADTALNILQEYVPEKVSMFASLEGKDLIEKSKYLETAHREKEVLDMAAQVVKLHKQAAECKANVQKLENQIETLSPWMNLDIPGNFQGTRTAAVLIGSMSGNLSLEDIYSLILEQAPEVSGVDISILSSERDTVYLAAVCLKKDVEKVEEILRQSGFAKPSQSMSKIPAREKEDLEQQIAVLQQEMEECGKEIASYASEREKFKLISDYFRARAEKYQILGQLPQSKKTFLAEGYVPAKAVPALEKALNANFDLSFETEEIPEEEEMPVLLENNGFSESVEGVLESYGLPKKGEIDPTMLMSFFYVFFFGLMLSDAAYGLVMFLGCFVILKKFPRMEQSLKKSIKMFMYCGVSTLIWGILFGGYFGDAIDVVARTFFHVEVPEGGLVKALWFVPLNEPMRMLMYSMAFGLIHLFVGLGIKGYMLLRDKKVLDFFCDVVLWYVFLIGLLLLLLPSSIFASIAQVDPSIFPPFVGSAGKILAIAGALGLLLMSGRSSKNFGLRLALGAYDIYNVTGWLSDVLSYSRLLALGLATGVIASVINQMGSMVGDSVLGVVVFLVVFVFGHTFNMAINILGAYVHTNRLQFVEFFGKFYEGGGKAFHPFKFNTKYVDIKEEKSL
ncbi:MAG TPA: V-type ATP synthase subunit I [Candidatus Blautia stercoravium]|nr:V-type ATP synthase subunit I [Candidatus Blautia stercoravium]